jgi:hypothetical protein
MIWGTLTGVLLTEALGGTGPITADVHDRALGWMMLGGTSLGIVAGSLFARRFEVSREHVAIIDASGALGLAIGYGIGFATGNDNSSNVVCRSGSCVNGARYALGGMALGLLGAAILTRHYKGDPPVQQALVEPRRGRFTLGVPTVQLAVSRAPEGLDRRLTIDLVRGRF